MPHANNNNGNNTYQLLSASHMQAPVISIPQLRKLKYGRDGKLCPRPGSRHYTVVELGFEPRFAFEVCVANSHTLQPFSRLKYIN